MERLPRKLDALSQDIIRLLEKNEPKMLMWREIRNILWENYKTKYKDIKSFGAAFSNKLKFLEAKGDIKKESDFYGTKNSKVTPQKTSLSQIDKEIQKVKEDYINGFVDKAFKRVTLLLESNESLKKDWNKQIGHVFAQLISKVAELDRELEIVRANPVEEGNFDRHIRIRKQKKEIAKLKGQIVACVLRHWTQKENSL